jgi:hypothetical protein
VCLDDQRAGVLKRIVVDRRFSVHDLVERRAIAIRVPQLEPRLTVRNKVVGIVGERVKPTSEHVLPAFFEHRGRGVHQELQGGQTLLTVNNVMRLQTVESAIIPL